MQDFCILTGFENVVSKIELDRSSLACTGTDILDGCTHITCIYNFITRNQESNLYKKYIYIDEKRL